jgi:hypothetical protein
MPDPPVTFRSQELDSDPWLNLTLDSCIVCHAVVVHRDMAAHLEWHRTKGEVGQ